jgi:hypothetical protein
MPYDKSKLRLERFQVEVAYHAAYNFLNLRGVLAERWAHGPIFGATNELPGQVTLLPGSQPGTESDQRLWASYGLRATGINAEGPRWVPVGQEIVESWLTDALQVLKPKRVVRLVVSLFALYPLDDAVQASRKLRGWAYRSQNLAAVLPPSAERHRDRYHSAIDFLVPDGDSGTALSVVVGAVGPPHRGSFFVHPDDERDGRWWMGFRVERRQVEEGGLEQPRKLLTTILKTTNADCEHIVQAVLSEIAK